MISSALRSFPWSSYGIYRSGSSPCVEKMEEMLKCSDSSVASSCVDITDGALKLSSVPGGNGVSVKDGRFDEYICGV